MIYKGSGATIPGERHGWNYLVNEGDLSGRHFLDLVIVELAKADADKVIFGDVGGQECVLYRTSPPKLNG